MEESISSSRTPGASASVLDGNVDCCASGPATGAASDDSGWTAYFIDSDDTYLQLHNSQEVPAKKPHRRAFTSTLSTASKIKVKAKKAAGTEEKNNKKKPRLEPADEDPLQDTACSPANAIYAARQLHLQDGWQIAECEQRSSAEAAAAALQWVAYCRRRRRQWDSREGPDAEIKKVFA